MKPAPISPTRLNRLITYSLMLSALVILIGGRIGGIFASDGWTATGLILFGLSCFTDPLLPGSTELNPQQVAMIRHLGIPYRDGAEKIVSLLVGSGFLAGGLYTLLG